MDSKVDIFLAAVDSNQAQVAASIIAAECVSAVHLLVADGWSEKHLPDAEGLDFICCESLTSSRLLRTVAQKAQSEYAALFLRPTQFLPSYRCFERLLQVAETSGAAFVYSDRWEQCVDADGKTEMPRLHPVIDYQEGALRDDFDFGGLWLVRTELLCRYVEEQKPRWRHAALYSLRLYLSREGRIVHLREPLYTEVQTDLRKSGEKQFDYVNPANREVQLEMERACTEHLKHIGAWLAPDEYDDIPVSDRRRDTSEVMSAYREGTDMEHEKYDVDFLVEASVIIPVRNRVKTITDAVRSALSQIADFEYNVIVVDNHSTDGTADAVAALCSDPRVVLLCPERQDLGIGGCWDFAIRSPMCGRYAIQLDSDDLYSGTDTLQRIVDVFQRQKVAMVIGSYRMVDFNQNTLPPGLIDHKEWTPDNGRNNALRINGLGAPRAFNTTILRHIGFPNTSYGEDYALGLVISRHYKIGRIFDELYLCRRWDGNSDAALSIEKLNKNNAYKDELRTLELEVRRRMNSTWNRRVKEKEVDDFFNTQMQAWDEVRERFEDVKHSMETRSFATSDDVRLAVQHNPKRIVSTGAKTDKRTLKRRPCFLCDLNRPAPQMSLPVEGKYQVLVNPFPILPNHLTVPTRHHVPQQLEPHLPAFLRMVWNMPNHIVFYNGPRCGASAPDHAHFQAGSRGVVPLERDWQQYQHRLERVYPQTHEEEIQVETWGYADKRSGLYMLRGYVCPAFVVLGEQPLANDQFPNELATEHKSLMRHLLEALPVEDGNGEPDVNALAWRQKGNVGTDDIMVCVVFVRSKHRPECYSAKGAKQMVVSPGAIDMGGLVITPRHEDFARIDAKMAASILAEVSLSEITMQQIARRLHKSPQRVRSSQKTRLVEEEPEVEVGIMSSDNVDFVLNAPYIAKGSTTRGTQHVEYQDGGICWNGNLYSELTFVPANADLRTSSFTLSHVCFGHSFHWQRYEEQAFHGVLRIIVSEGKLVVINRLPVELYLESVISSEMCAMSDIELLKAHAVISRSWLFRQMQNRRSGDRNEGGFFSVVRKDDEYIRWYGNDEHVLFDVCADDHCQRYQGVTRVVSPEAAEAVRQTRGQVLEHNGIICDTRFSKCCGGVTERYSSCWENKDETYLQPQRDAEYAGDMPDLTVESEADKWIRESPEGFCNTTDENLLRQVLNDYDRETSNFYRWQVCYTQQELSELIRSKREENFGEIIDLQPVERGASGRIIRLRIVGSKRTIVIGKELEIRRTLSPTHLYSSAFVVDKSDYDGNVPGKFTIIGAGWGHGVGLCQIGAAVMANKGYAYDEILQHYYRNSELTELYK